VEFLKFTFARNSLEKGDPKDVSLAPAHRERSSRPSIEILVLVNGLVDLGYGDKRVDHGHDEFAKKDGTHINGIKGFWGIEKVGLARFRGMAPQNFYLRLKETEFRYDNRGKNLGGLIFKNLQITPAQLVMPHVT